MNRRFNIMRTALAVSVALAGSVTGCNSPRMGSVDGELAIGTWGGDNAGVIVVDSLAHVHVGCTYGDFPGRVALDAAGRFSMAGSYLLRAYPVAVGPTMPAQFSGRLEGTTLTFTVTVTDTIENKVAALGPATVILGKEPRMGPCPICRTPGDRARIHRRTANPVRTGP